MPQKFLVRLVLTVFVLLGLVNCGSDGGSSSSSDGPTSDGNVRKQFDTDLRLLTKTVVDPKAKSLPTFDTFFERVFGDRDSSAVKQFIDARVKHVYSADEVLDFPIQVYLVDGLHIFTLRDFRAQENIPSGVTMQAVNYGSSLARLSYELNAPLRMTTPSQDLTFDTPRVGLIGLAKSYQSQNGKELPLEVRVAILAHEARHSDCPEGSGSETCGFPHGRCPADHDLAGETLCDGAPWGPYAIDSIYLDLARRNYATNTQKSYTMQVALFDSYSRILPEHLVEMKITEPLLNTPQ